MSRSDKNRSAKASSSRRPPASGVSRRALMIGAAALAGGGAAAWTLLRPWPVVAAPEIAVWKSPQCGCCGGWVSYMRGLGYRVAVTEIEDLGPTKAMLGVPDSLQACHTARVGNYVLEGHVPEAAVARLLRERPTDIAGLALPGMPEGAPGMDGTPRRYQILAFGRDGRSHPYMATGV